MMKRKISILTLTFLFFAATTGLPVTVHFCKMMESASLEACEMHEVKVEKSSCCESEAPEYPVKLTSEIPACCQSEFIYNKVKDDFLFNKTNENLKVSSENLVYIVVVIPEMLNVNIKNSLNNDSSPPFLINPDIYISNSVLLI